MRYEVAFTRRAAKDLEDINRSDVERILDRIQALRDDLQGDVKRLTGTTSEYRLRIGDYRALFEVEDELITIHRVRHRKDVYRGL